MNSTTIHTRTPEHNTRRFKYKLHMIISDEKGNVIKDCKYCSAEKCSQDNIELFKNRQVVGRIVNGYKFSEFFTKYDCVKITKINEKLKTKIINKRVLVDCTVPSVEPPVPSVE